MNPAAADRVSSASLRPRYLPGQILGELDLVDERGSRDRSMRLHRLSAHGFGVLSGLEVALNNGRLELSPGVAIDGFGFELVVPEPMGWLLSEFLVLLDGSPIPSSVRQIHVLLARSVADAEGSGAELRFRCDDGRPAPDPRRPDGVDLELAGAPSVVRARQDQLAWEIPAATLERTSEEPWRVVLSDRRRAVATSRVRDVQRDREWSLRNASLAARRHGGTSNWVVDGVSKCVRADTVQGALLRAPEVRLPAVDASFDDDYVLMSRAGDGSKTVQLSVAADPTGSLRIGGVTFRLAEKELQVVGDVEIQGPEAAS